MEKLFNKPNYLILFREQHEFLYSLWLHRVRKGIKKTFCEFVSKENIGNRNIKKSKNFITNYKLYNFNKIFNPYLQIFKKRVYFLNIQKISNEKYFNEVISLFIKHRNFKLLRNKLNHKVNISREYELIYFYLFKKVRLINNFILISIILFYKYFLFFLKYEKLNYKHEHFNKATFKYFDIVNFLLKKKIIGKKFLNEIQLMKKIIKTYYMNSNRIFYKKIYGKENK